MKQRAKQQAKKYEEGRIGKGYIAAFGAEKLNSITGGRTGETIIKPHSTDFLV